MYIGCYWLRRKERGSKWKNRKVRKERKEEAGRASDIKM